MRTILVTGAAGFIGWKTCEFLLEEGMQVVGIDNMNDYYDIRVKDYRLDLLKRHRKFQFINLDIEDLGGLKGLFISHTFDSVINLAARAGVRYSMDNPFVYMATNALGTLNLLEMMRKQDIRKMVLASTSSALCVAAYAL